MNFKIKSNLDAFKLFQDLMSKQRSSLSGRIPKNGGRAMIGWGLLLYRLIAAKAPSKSIVKILRTFAFECFRISRGSGLGHLVKYLKTCSILLQQYVAKNDATYDSRKVGGVAVSCTRKGLPRIIPRLQRRLIRKGDRNTITFWLSLFNVYRYLDCPYGPNNYSTITDKGVGWRPDAEVLDYISQFWRLLDTVSHGASKKPLPEGEPFLFSKVSVSIREQEQLMGTSYPAVIRSAWNWRWLADRLAEPKRFVNGKLDNVLKGVEWKRGNQLLRGLMKFIGSQPALGPILWGLRPGGLKANKLLGPGTPVNFTQYIPDKYSQPYLPPATEDRTQTPFGTWTYSPCFGRLVALREAAGKIRIIAIVDPLTQWLLRPLHKWIFSILRGIPQDGTFNQEAPIKRLMELSRKSKDQFIGSCDMSAATDRLPIDLQVHILSAKFGRAFAFAWKHLLVSRDYVASFTPYRYAVGQPMGALSSWAMLALTHHFLWQWAAWRSGVNPTFRWFKEYAVLGDDSASRLRPVVDEYLKICHELGVKVNLAKSLLSRGGCLEFAKRFMTPRGDCSPVSMGELLVSKVNFSVMSNWPRKRPIRLADLLYIMGYKHRTVSTITKPLASLPRRLRHMLIVLKSPWGAMPSASLEEWLLLSSFKKVSSSSLDVAAIGIELIKMFYVLHTKSQKTVAWNALPNRLMGISGGHKATEGLVERVRKKDPNTFRAVHATVYEPVRKKTFEEAKVVMRAITEQRTQLMRRVFLADMREMEEFWKEYLRLEEQLFQLRWDTSRQRVDKPFVMPSARSVVKLYNKFRLII